MFPLRNMKVLPYFNDQNTAQSSLSYELPKQNNPLTFAAYTVAIFILFVIYGYFQELIFQLVEFRPFGLYLTLYQFLLYGIFSFIERAIRKEYERRIPFKDYIVLAFLTVGTMGLSNTAVGYLNYPTQVVFKCCKLIPVLIGGILIQGKAHNIGSFIAAGLMSIGLTLFTLADSEVSPNFNLIGYVLISGALIADAAIGNLQEKNLKQYSASNCEMVFFSYTIGIIYIVFVLVCINQLGRAFQFCSQHLKETYGYGFIFSLTGYFGVNLVLSLVKLYGAFTAVTVTTCRKALSIALSFMLFSKPFTMQYLWSGLLIVCGIYVNVYKNKTSEIIVDIKQKIFSYSQRKRSSHKCLSNV